MLDINTINSFLLQVLYFVFALIVILQIYIRWKRAKNLKNATEKPVEESEFED